MKINIKEKNIKKYIEEITGINLTDKEYYQQSQDKQSTTPLTLIDPIKKTGIILHTLRDLEQFLLTLDTTILLHNAQQHSISTWLKKIGATTLANNFSTIESTIHDAEKMRKKMIDILEENRYSLHQDIITDFQRSYTDGHIQLTHIGTGSFGGKARGISFIANIFSTYLTDNMFPGLRLTIPRSIIISTNVFDQFIKQNHLDTLDFSHLSDERIAAKFIAGSLPATIIGDIRSFIENTHKPLILRSSSLLEDSLLQPFAGIYASMLLPNESWTTQQRFQEISNAIKYVYASTFFEKARTYIKSTSKNITDEKMAVLLQEVVGTKHDQYFYPTISGVAKSYNYYPTGPCKPEEGIVYLALGLGKSIVDGGSTYCFCPEKPQAPLFGTPKDFIKYSQKKFYALKLKSVYSTVNKNEETTLETLDIDTAKKHGVLPMVVSTYSYQDDQLYPGLNENGSIVIDFGPIINYESIPLASALKLLLRISEHALETPVELEFAVDFPSNNPNSAELVILQIRSMIPPPQYQPINLDDINLNNVLCYSNNALGNGIITDISDIVFIKSPAFTMANSQRAVDQIRQINTTLMDDNRPYILIGPGRWGSADPWLGIPVNWSDIAGVKVIIETPYQDRPITPSQGSHFFHDMISSQIGYIITKKNQGNISWKWLDSLPLVKETEDIKHVRSPKPLDIIIDGKQSKAIIKEKNKNHTKK